MYKKVRTRFAPSPTGFLHIGGIRTALYNYLLAKKFNGDFILRIEDTDKTRFVPEAQDYIIETLKWLKIEPNEGVCFGEGDYGPYIQSDRKDIYQKYAKILVEKGYAYYAFDTDEELSYMHDCMLRSHIKNPQYDFISRDFMKNSLTLSEDEVKNRINSGEKYVIRFKVPKGEIVRFYDIVRGEISINTITKEHTASIDDKVLLKSDGMATYHLASMVDDHLMQISHIIRGEEWLPSAPLHVLIYKAFGWEMPQLLHLPLLLKPDGKGKLSKREAYDGGLTIFPLSFIDKKNGKEIIGLRENGYLPEAVINALSLLGWNPGNNKEIFSIDELINDFSLEKIQKSGARFNVKKFEWFNHQYIKNSSNDDLKEYFKEYSNEDDYKLDKICDLVKERAFFTTDIYKNSKCFFEEPKVFNGGNLTSERISFSLKWIEDFMKLIIDKKFEYSVLHDFLNEKLEKDNLKMVDVMPTFRLILFGEVNGPDVVKSILILGIEETNKRICNFKKNNTCIN